MAGNLYVKLMGGLGNQLYQAASGYAYAQRHRMSLFLDTSAWFCGQGEHPSVYRDSIFRNFEFNCAPAEAVECGYGASPPSHECFLRGYLDDFTNFREFRSDLESRFEVPLLAGDPETAAIHVRGGDFRVTGFCMRDIDGYYARAVGRFPQGTRFDVYSDDPSFAQACLKDTGAEFTYVEGNSVFDEFVLLSSYEKVVIPNSTFSWWATFFSHGMVKDVTVPLEWQPGRPIENGRKREEFQYV